MRSSPCTAKAHDSAGINYQLPEAQLAASSKKLPWVLNAQTKMAQWLPTYNNELMNRKEIERKFSVR